MRGLGNTTTLFVVVTSALSAAGCGNGASSAATPQDRPPTPVHVETVVTRQVEDRLQIPGIVEPRTRISLGFRIDGFLTRLDADEGDRVNAGDVLAALDLTDLERDVRMARVAGEQAAAQAAEAKLLSDRQKELLASRNTSQQVYDRARLAWEGARAQRADAALRLEGAEDRLRKGVLRAPITGYVERRLLEVHEPAKAGQPVFVLTDLDTVTVRAAVADTAIGRLRVGGTAIVRSAAHPDREFPGTISRIHVAADPVTRTCPFELTVANPAIALLPETVVTVDVSTGRSAPVQTVPLATVLRDAAAEPFCYVAAGEGEDLRAERRPVGLGPPRGRRVTITSGLANGDRVVTRGQHFLGDGDPVRIVPE